MLLQRTPPVTCTHASAPAAASPCAACRSLMGLVMLMCGPLHQQAPSELVRLTVLTTSTSSHAAVLLDTHRAGIQPGSRAGLSWDSSSCGTASCCAVAFFARVLSTGPCCSDYCFLVVGVSLAPYPVTFAKAASLVLQLCRMPVIANRGREVPPVGVRAGGHRPHRRPVRARVEQEQQGHRLRRAAGGTHA